MPDNTTAREVNIPITESSDTHQRSGAIIATPHLGLTMIQTGIKIYLTTTPIATARRTRHFDADQMTTAG